MEAIFGYTKLDAGEIFIHGKKVNIFHARDALKYVWSFNRRSQRHGLFPAAFDPGQHDGCQHW
jgi:ABC-type sugar transport system ATPase subunit